MTSSKRAAPPWPSMRPRMAVSSLIGPLEPAAPQGRRPRERALLVAEQLGVDQVRRDGPAVDAEERSPGPRRAVVDGPPDHFLARPGLADDGYGDVSAGEEVHAFHDGAQAGVAAHDRVDQLLASQA